MSHQVVEIIRAFLDFARSRLFLDVLRVYFVSATFSFRLVTLVWRFECRMWCLFILGAIERAHFVPIDRPARDVSGTLGLLLEKVMMVY